MKKLNMSILILCGMIGIQFFGFYHISFAKEYRLRYWTHDSPNSYRVKEIYQILAKRINEATDGKVIVEISAMSPITNPRDAHDAAAAGLVDIALCITGVSPGRYPLLDSIGLPGLGYNSSVMASLGAANLIEKFPIIEKRMGNVKILEIAATGVDMVGTSNKPIKTINDFRGLKLRSSGDYPSKLLKSLGVIPIMMGPGDIYSNMQKGVVDGFNMPWGGIRIFKLNEVTNYCLETNNWVGVFFSVMNLDKWNSLPSDIQAKINQVSGSEWSRHIGQVTDNNEDRNRATAERSGAVISIPSPKLKAQMREQGKKIWDQYVSNLNKKGLPGNEILKTHLDFIKNYKK